MVLAIDIGGTKVAVAAVGSQGEIVERHQSKTILDKGIEGFTESIAQAARSILKNHDIRVGGLASAGPLDPVKGNLVNPTNLKTNGKAWGEVPLVASLEDILGIDLIMENDAAAAILGEAWVGEAQNTSSSMIITLGTGVGVGVISEGKLLRLRHSYHPEASHFSLNFTDKDAPCGCGNFGCVEAYLSGKNFVRYANKKFGTRAENGRELIKLANSQDPSALEAFDFYSEVMAQAINAYCVLFAPETVIFSGGFSRSFELFHRRTRKHLERLLSQRRQGLDFMPELKLSKHQEDAGLLGAARAAMRVPGTKW